MGGFKVEGVITDHNNKEDMRARLRQLSSYGRGKCRQRDKHDLAIRAFHGYRESVSRFLAFHPCDIVTAGGSLSRALLLLYLFLGHSKSFCGLPRT